MHDEATRVLSIARRQDADVRMLVRCGSQVYGTAGPASDHDYLLVLAEPTMARDLLFADRINITVQGSRAFEKALADQSVFALECALTPDAHRLKASRPPFSIKIDPQKLGASALARSQSDYRKGVRTFEEEPVAARKKIYHALRVLTYACQLAERGTIFDFGAARAVHDRVMLCTARTQEDAQRAFDTDLRTLEVRLTALVGRSGRRRRG